MPLSGRSAQVACAIVGWGRLWSCRARSHPSSSSFCGGVSERCSFKSMEQFACFRLNVCVGGFREWGQRAWLCVPQVRGEQEATSTEALSAGRGAWPRGQRWHQLWYRLGDSFGLCLGVKSTRVQPGGRRCICPALRMFPLPVT